MDNMASVNNDSLENGLKMCKTAVKLFVSLIKNRFNSFEGGVFKLPTLQFWRADRDFGNTEIGTLIGFLTLPYQATRFVLKKALSNWKFLRLTTKSFHDNISVVELWKKHFTYRKEEYSSILKQVEPVI